MLSAQTKYNILPFNRGSISSHELDGACNFYGDLHALIGVGQDIPDEGIGGVSCSVSVILTHGVPDTGSGNGDMQSDVIVTGGLPETAPFSGTLKASVQISKKIPDTASGSAALEASLRIVKDLPDTVSASASINASVGIAKSIPDFGENGGLLNAVMEVSRMNIGTIKLTQPLKSGQTVVLDTESYTLLVDNANAMEYHAGDWPEIDRGTLRIEIDSGSGKVSGKLTVIPRYL